MTNYIKFKVELYLHKYYEFFLTQCIEKSNLLI